MLKFIIDLGFWSTVYSMQDSDLNTQPFKYESTPLATRPGLPHGTTLLHSKSKFKYSGQVNQTRIAKVFVEPHLLTKRHSSSCKKMYFTQDAPISGKPCVLVGKLNIV